MKSLRLFDDSTPDVHKEYKTPQIQLHSGLVKSE